MFKNKEEYVAWAKGMVTYNARMQEEHETLVKGVATFDPTAAEFVRKDMEVLTELCTYLKAKIDPKAG